MEKYTDEGMEPLGNVEYAAGDGLRIEVLHGPESTLAVIRDLNFRVRVEGLALRAECDESNPGIGRAIAVARAMRAYADALEPWAVRQVECAKDRAVESPKVGSVTVDIIARMPKGFHP